MTVDEQLEIRSLARDFADGEIRPYAAQWDAAGALPDALFAKLAELGFLGMRVPEGYGGLGFDMPTYLVVLEELARADASVALVVAIQNGSVTETLLRYGSDTQKERLLPRLAAGELVGAFALGEDAAGSDLDALLTRAERSPSGWTLGGHKRWVTNGAGAGLVLVVARTGAEGVGCFALELPVEGYRAEGGVRMMGLCAAGTVAVALDGVELPAEALVGGLEAARPLVHDARTVGRVGVAALALGIGEAAVGHATRYALERRQFGQPIAHFGAVRAKLAAAAAGLASARAFTQDVGRELDVWRGGVPSEGTGIASLPARAAAAKMVASEIAVFAADEAVQIFGGYGYMRDYPVEKLLRDAQGTELYEGTTETLREGIAREMLSAAQPGG